MVSVVSRLVVLYLSDTGTQECACMTPHLELLDEVGHPVGTYKCGGEVRREPSRVHHEGGEEDSLLRTLLLAIVGFHSWLVSLHRGGEGLVEQR